MSRTVSRLDTLLRVRRIEEELSRGRLGGAAASERAAGRELDRVRDDYAASPAAPASPGLGHFLAHHTHAQALAGSVQGARAQVTQAAHELAMARDFWSDAAMRMSALERLEERASQARRLDRLAADQQAAEEAGAVAGRTAGQARGRRG